MRRERRLVKQGVTSLSTWSGRTGLLQNPGQLGNVRSIHFCCNKPQRSERIINSDRKISQRRFLKTGPKRGAYGAGAGVVNEERQCWGARTTPGGDPLGWTEGLHSQESPGHEGRKLPAEPSGRGSAGHFALFLLWL